MSVWESGLQAADLLKTFGAGDNHQPLLETNRLNQLFVSGILKTSVHHQLALGGVKKTALIKLSEMLDRTHRPRIKLH